MVKVLLVGADGNMGKRYASILNFLRISCIGIDIADGYPEGTFDRVIIATPTNTHIPIINKITNLYPYTPILCEKPLSRSIPELEESTNVYMVNNYSHYIGLDPDAIGPTVYDYFHTGTDGLEWDCIQLIGLANAEIKLMNKSPFWICKINGKTLTKDGVDHSYILMIDDFCNEMKNVINFESAKKIHQKVLECLK